MEAGQGPKWVSHSLRRCANTAAQRFKKESGATAPEIDLFFGWHEKVLLAEMQRHYEGMSIRVRMALAKITGWL